MPKIVPLTILLYLSSPGLADPDADAVNERIPVDKKAMEQHWGVDCAGAWARTQDPVKGQSANGQRVDTAELLHQLRLCAFIYQAPGETPDQRHPDYRGAADAISNQPGQYLTP